MFTIHDVAEMDNWSSTCSFGSRGLEILASLRELVRESVIKRKQRDICFDVDYDVETTTPGHGKYIIKGIPHNSSEERKLLELIFTKINPLNFTELWDDKDFLRINRKTAIEQLADLRNRVEKEHKINLKYNSTGELPCNYFEEKRDFLPKDWFFGHLYKFQGIIIGYQPPRFYEAPAQNLKKGKYSVFSILEEVTYFKFKRIDELWIQDDDNFLAAIDRLRGRKN